MRNKCFGKNLISLGHKIVLLVHFIFFCKNKIEIFKL